jgi:hypothetical protein
MSEYVVIYEQAEDGGWGAYIPDLPGVVALGSTRPEAQSASRRRSPRTPRIFTSGAWHFRILTTPLAPPLPSVAVFSAAADAV